MIRGHEIRARRTDWNNGYQIRSALHGGTDYNRRTALDHFRLLKTRTVITDYYRSGLRMILQSHSGWHPTSSHTRTQFIDACMTESLVPYNDGPLTAIRLRRHAASMCRSDDAHSYVCRLGNGPSLGHLQHDSVGSGRERKNRPLTGKHCHHAEKPKRGNYQAPR